MLNVLGKYGEVIVRVPSSLFSFVYVLRKDVNYLVNGRP